MKFSITLMLALVAATCVAQNTNTNTPPLIGDVPDQVIAQSTSTATNYFTIGDGQTTFSALAVTAVSSNPALVPNVPANLILGGNSSQRTIKVTPVAGQTGSTVVTLTVSDGTNTASSAFSLLVTPPNTAPTLSGLPGFQRAAPGQSPPPVLFVVNDAETSAGSLTVVATSSNTNLVPNANLALSGSGTNRTVQLTPAPGQTGSAVIKLRVTDALGAFAQGEFIFSVFDAGSPNNHIRQPRGLFVLDSGGGSSIGGVPMRDSNIRDKPFVDGYVLRTDWDVLEPTDGGFNFTIISNIFAKLPANQKLSLIVSGQPAWLTTLPGITTWTGGNPVVTRPIPWDDVTQERLRLLLIALGDFPVQGTPLRNHPRLAVLNVAIPGLTHGIRDPEIKIRDIPGYARTNLENTVLTHLKIVTDNFPAKPVQLGFWTFVDQQDTNFNNVTPWEQLRQVILAEFDGVSRPRIGFWMENLAANRPAAETDPWAGLPNTSFAAPEFLSQSHVFIGYQSLGSWAKPFNDAHVDNNLNGSPEDGLDYGFNVFQSRYFEVYQADVDFANYTAEFQRWHDFLAALPLPTVTLAVQTTSPGQFNASFTALASQRYEIESTANLTSWSTFGAITNPNNVNATLPISIPATNAQQFFRLKCNP